MKVKLFGRIKKAWNALKLSDEKAWNTGLWNLARAAQASGESVTEETALTYSAVYNAVSLIAGTVSTLPLHLIRKDNRKTVRMTSHGLYRLLHDSPNPFMTAMAMREVMMAHVLTWGNGYAEIVRDGMGQIVQLWPITPNRVQPKWEGQELVYEIRVSDGAPVTLGRDKILHVAGLGFDGLVGYSVISMAAKSIGLGMAMETFGSNYFGQGTHPGVIVSHPGVLGDQAAKNLQDSLTNAYSGLGNTHKLMLLEEGMSIEKLGIPPNDSQFLESRQFQIPEIARWFNLPPHKLKDLTKSSFNNIESEQISFVTDSILPWLIRLEQNFNMQLLSAGEKRQGLYFKHSVEGLLRGSAKDRGEFYSSLWNVGAICINEIREKEDMDPIEGGDEYFVPLNMSPLSQAGQTEPQIPEIPQEGSDGAT